MTAAVPVTKYVLWRGVFFFFFIMFVLTAGVSKLGVTLVLLIMGILHCPSCL